MISDDGSGTAEAPTVIVPLTVVVGRMSPVRSNICVLLPITIETATGPAGVPGATANVTFSTPNVVVGGPERVTKPGEVMSESEAVKSLVGKVLKVSGGS
jgi:hypothetical protein